MVTNKDLFNGDIFKSAQVAKSILTMPEIFKDHMVLQRDTKLQVWGSAFPKEKVKIDFVGQTKETAADENGSWSIELDQLNAGGPYTMTVKGEGSSQICIQDVLIGDVWVCAGQSNMSFCLENDQWGKLEIANISLPYFREFRCRLPECLVKRTPDNIPEWNECTKDKADKFSAVGYYFGRKIHEVSGVPVGIVIMARGDTLCESWIDIDYLKQKSEFKPLIDEWDNKSAILPDIENHIYYPGLFFREVVQPVLQFKIKGVIWYQGESNALPNKSERTILQRTTEYRELFPALIQNWRAMWNQNELPFYFVQLPNFNIQGVDLLWAEIRDAQLDTMRTVPGTGMAVTIDIGMSSDLHPTNKRDVGLRLALWALSNSYGINILPSGPIFNKMIVRDGKAVLFFDYTGDGLMTPDNKPLEGFEISGADGRFCLGYAEINENTVEVYSPEIKSSVAVRYAWADDPKCNLFNKAGLPASPFHSSLYYKK